MTLACTLITGMLLIGPVLPTDLDLDLEWGMFKVTYNKTYSGDEEARRRVLWENAVYYINQHNLEADNGHHSYRLGMNQYGDLSHEEFVSTMNGYKRTVNNYQRDIKEKICGSYHPPESRDLPESVDWRKEGYVTGVKNQGVCGACWAFSATGSLEGQHYKKYGALVSLSESNLIDCSFTEGNDGCASGEMDNAFAYVIKNGGIDTAASYPYYYEPRKCRYQASGVGANMTGCRDVDAGSEVDLQAAVAAVGPISASVDAQHLSFQYYMSGIYSEPNCSTIKLDHGLLVVGYGSESGSDYWLIKNSWGTSWGLQGYMMMSRNNNMCGIATDASFPTM